MLTQESKIGVVDKSGAITAKIIKVFNKKKNIGFSSNIVKVSIQRVFSNRKIIKGQLFRALLIKTRSISFRRFGHIAKGKSNGLILLKKMEDIPYSRRLKGVVFLELRQVGFSKLLSVSDFVV
jgi:large subunit ribosomal protein L14